mmetsp:Transcript_51885/g.168665  ORF Transcript_51885/g.168665 Transcript_51885/m.168665 type:complete len:251 (-) Transcript_51885:886-1638(-)
MAQLDAHSTPRGSSCAPSSRPASVFGATSRPARKSATTSLFALMARTSFKDLTPCGAATSDCPFSAMLMAMRTANTTGSTSNKNEGPCKPAVAAANALPMPRPVPDPSPDAAARLGNGRAKAPMKNATAMETKEAPRRSQGASANMACPIGAVAHPGSSAKTLFRKPTMHSSSPRSADATPCSATSSAEETTPKLRPKGTLKHNARCMPEAPTKSVSVAPGIKQVTPTPDDRNSSRSPAAKDRSKALLAA